MPKYDIVEPWERQKGESPKAYEAFCVYRDLGAERSLRKTSQKLGKNTTTIGGWSSKFSWVERARSYDISLEREAHKKAQKEYGDMIGRHVRLGLKLQQTALKQLDALTENGGTMKPRDIKEFIALGAELERLSREITIDEQTREDDGFIAALNGIAGEVNADAGDIPDDLDPEDE